MYLFIYLFIYLKTQTYI